METFHEKLRIDDLKMTNNIYEIKKRENFDYLKKQKIICKKYSNSADFFINKKKKLANKFNLTDKYMLSVVNKAFRKQKTSIFEIDKNYSKPSIIENLVNKNYINKKSIRKLVSFNEENKIFSNNNINNNIQINDDIIPKRPKFKTISEPYLPIPIKSKKEYKKEDFDVIALCGKGAYGTVLQVKLKKEEENKKNIKKSKKKEPENYYAIKVIDIQSMKKVNKIYQIYLESEILNELNSPFIVKIFGTFQTQKKVYMVLEYLSNGNFATFLKNNFPLKEDTIKFYSAWEFCNFFKK